MSVGTWGVGPSTRWQHMPETQYLLVLAPVGALLVGLVDLLASAGLASAQAALGFALVAVFYLVQVFATLRSPEWADTWWAPAQGVAASISSPLFCLFLEDPRPSLVWFWLIGGVVMLCAYLCTPARAAATWAATAVVGLLFASSSGLSLWDHSWLLASGVVANAIPGAASALGLGRIRRRERHVLEQTRLDPLTGVLNRRGLDHELEEWADRLGGDQPVSVVSIHLEGFDDASAAWGGTVADQVLARVGVGLARAYHRSHLVARFVEHEFVVVSDLDPDLLVPSLLRAVRVASPQRPVTASAGVVREVPLELLTQGQLLPLLERARLMLARAEVASDGMAQEVFDPDTYVPVGVPPPVPRPQHAPGEEWVGAWVEAEGRLLGWWLAALAMLLSAVPRAHGWPGPLVAVGYVGCLLLAVGGVLLAQQPQSRPRPAQALVLLAVPLSAGVLAGAAGPEERYVLLQLAVTPAVVGAVYLSAPWVRLLVALLPLSVVVATAVGPRPSPYALSVSLSAIVFTAVATLMAAYVRRRSMQALAELHALTLTDPTTGVLTRQGLARDFLDLPPTDRAGVLLVSVQQRTDDRGASAMERDMVLVATSLHELARGRGLVGRVGGRELAMVVRSADRMSLLRRHLDADLAENAPQVRVLVGHAYADEHSEGGLWRAMAEADASVRAQRAGHAPRAHLVPADGAPAAEDA